MPRKLVSDELGLVFFYHPAVRCEWASLTFRYGRQKELAALNAVLRGRFLKWFGVVENHIDNGRRDALSER